ncbi:MAG: hypothetical protein IJ996_03050 [Clostridia bacterium]|nr:hypothetical protein [Clostridia bacterium]
MIKKLLYAGLLAMVFVVCAFCVACKENTEKPSPNENVPSIVSSIALNQSSITMNVYDSERLEATLVQLEGQVEWMSSNTDILTVENGNVYAVGLGMATVTAQLQGYKATCEVTVTNAKEIAPVLMLDTVDLPVGKDCEYVVNAGLFWKNEKIKESYDYVWSVDENAKNTVSVTAVDGTNGKQAIIKGLELGTGSCWVTVNVLGVDLVAEVSVEVYQVGTAIFLTNFEQEHKQYVANLSIIDANDGQDKTSIMPEFMVLDDGELVENPEVEFVSLDEEIVRVDNGKLQAVGIGMATVMATCQESSVSVKVNVYRPTIYMNETLEFEKAVKSIQFESTLIGSGQKVWLDGREIGSVNAQTITYDLSETDISLAEKRTAKLETDKAIYVFGAMVYTKVIRTVAEFENIRNYDSVGVKMGDYTYRTGYYVLGADLDFEGKAPNSCNFAGTFDGRGYTISNMYLSQNGLFGSVRKSAVIRNFNVVSSIVDVSKTSGIIVKEAHNGFVLSDINVEVRFVGTVSETGNIGTGLIGYKSYLGAHNNHEIERCVVIADISGLTGDAKKVSACFVGYNQHNPDMCVAGKSHTAYETFNVTDSIALIVGENDGDYEISEIYGTRSFTAETVSAYVLPTLTNVQVFNSATEYQEWIDGNATNLNSEALDFLANYIFENIMTLRYTTVGDPDVNMYNKTATVALTDLAIVDGDGSKLTLTGMEVASVKVGAKELLNGIASISNGTLTLRSETERLVNDLGTYRGQTELTITCLISDGVDAGKRVIYTVPVTLADYVITTKEEYRKLSTYLTEANTVTEGWNPLGGQFVATNGYFVLGGNVDFNENQIVDTTNAKRVALIGGTFDGQGYTLSGATFYGNAMFEQIRNGATIKNLNVVDCDLNLWNRSASVIARVAGNGFTISNVYVQMDVIAKPQTEGTNDFFGLIGRQYNVGYTNHQVIENCTVLASVSEMKGSATQRTGLFIGVNCNSDGVVGEEVLSKIKVTNCIGIITDTNENGYKLNGNFGEATTLSAITQTNTGFYASWTAYESATLTGYNANMLAFINRFKPSAV